MIARPNARSRPSAGSTVGPWFGAEWSRSHGPRTPIELQDIRRPGSASTAIRKVLVVLTAPRISLKKWPALKLALAASIRPAVGPRLHVHPQPEVFVVEAGEATFTVAEENLIATAGWLVDPGGADGASVGLSEQPGLPRGRLSSWAASTPRARSRFTRSTQPLVCGRPARLWSA